MPVFPPFARPARRAASTSASPLASAREALRPHFARAVKLKLARRAASQVCSSPQLPPHAREQQYLEEEWAQATITVESRKS